MPRHNSVPDNQTGWIHLGTVTTDTAELAIVAPEIAAVLGDEWCSVAAYIPNEELVEFEQVNVGDEGDTALLFHTYSDGGYLVEGRFGDEGGGHMRLMEVRIRIWWCGCSCHGSEPDGENTCDGGCHDEDPPGA